MRRAIHALAAVIVLISISSSSAKGQYWYYYMDGSQIPVQVFDDLVCVRLDPTSGWNSAMYAQLRECLDDNFDPYLLPHNCASYRIGEGYTLEAVMWLLRSDPDVLMVNPVLRSPQDDTTYISGDFIVRYLEGATHTQIDALNQQLGVELSRSFEYDSLCAVLTFPQKTSSTILDICNDYFESGLCLYSEPDFVWLHCYDGIPDDSLFEYQWPYMNTGAYGGTIDADIDMTEAYDYAFDYSTGDRRPTVFLLDSGFDMEHEDLRSSWYQLQYDVCGEIEYVPIPDYWPEFPCDDIRTHCWHGTAVLGVLAAWTGNSLGLAGVDPGLNGRCYIAPVKISGQAGDILAQNVISAFQHVSGGPYDGPTRDHIISCSWHLPDTSGYSSALETAIQHCFDQSMPVFFSSGNRGYVEYPARLPTVYAVGATDRHDLVWALSGRGESLDLSAPGYDVWSFDLTGDSGIVPFYATCSPEFGVDDPDYYCHYSGTSFASPLAAAVAAEVLARRPDFFNDPSPERLFNVLRNSAEDKGTAGFDPSYGWGRLNADRALLSVTRGDANNDGLIDIDDVNYLIAYIFTGGPAPQPHIGNGDADCQNQVDMDDVVYIIAYIFTGGPEPPDCFDFDYFDM